MDHRSLELASLPSEIILSILSPLETRLLLPMTRVSRRFHDLALRIICDRLVIAASLGDRMLLFECFHPAARLFEPELLCQYLGTDGLDDLLGCVYSYRSAPAGESLGKLSNMYSRFRPRRRDVERRNPTLYRRHPAGDVPGSRTHARAEAIAAAQQSSGDATVAEEELIKQVVHLDAGSLFTQLSALTSLAKAGPRRGLFTSIVPVSEGVIRVFRDWLSEQNEVSKSEDKALKPGQFGNQVKGESGEVEAEVEGTPMATKDASTATETNNTLDGVLWVNDGQNVGVRLKVRERSLRRENPILVHKDEEVAVSYEIQFEELLVRTRHLLLATERSLYEHHKILDKAMIFGEWR